MTDQGIQNLRMTAELQGELSGNVFESLIESFPDIVHSVNGEGTIISVNKRSTELLGYSRDELIGMNILELYDPAIADRVKKGFRQLKKKGFNEGIESRMISKSGEVIDVEIRSISLYNQDNTFSRTFSIIRDIREKKRIQGQLFQQSKLAGIGELAAGIIHDIKNPLAVIKAVARKGVERALEEQSFERVLDVQKKITKAADRIDKLCSHLRDYMRQEHEVASSVNLHDLMSDCLMILENRIQSSRARIVNEFNSPDDQIVLPANAVEQILINIIANACDAVSTCEKREVRVRYELSEDFVAFVIEDSGPGIPPKIQSQIFESFFTTKPKGKGTGLGLSICAGLAKEHGGQISIDSTYAGGARFVVRFPTQRAQESSLAS